VKLADLTDAVVRNAIEVHRRLGPGLRAPTYEEALAFELGEAGLRLERQVSLPILYKGRAVGVHPVDLVVERELAVDIRTTEPPDPAIQSPILQALRSAGRKAWLLLNFGRPSLAEGLSRFIL
jgi:GxxExxY protein